VLCFSECNLLVIAANDDVASIDDVMKTVAGLMGWWEFLLSDSIFQLPAIEFS